MKSLVRRLPSLILSSTLALGAGCHSFHIDVDVENHTGSAIRLMEVDYPSASFGADNLAVGAVMHYRFQVQGNGPLKVQYTAADGRQVQINGPNFAERQEGSLKILLLPDGKAEFDPVVTPRP
jgi:hypothetical protein